MPTYTNVTNNVSIALIDMYVSRFSLTFSSYAFVEERLAYTALSKM